MLTNTATRYGAVARLFHWAIALLVLVDLVIGIVGKNIARNADTVDFLQLLYSTHKTIGVTVLMLAVLRVFWAVTQARPAPIHPERRVETFAAETAHWLLYGAILILPLSGWVMHSAEVGFAPIWWPFGQNLPFVPKSEAIAITAGNVHWAAGIVLAATSLAHIGGAMKHALLEKDGTLARMVRGTDAGSAADVHGAKTPSAIAALVIWGLAIGGAVTAFAPSHDDTNAAMASDATSGWIVQSGSVEITIQQIGAPVTGNFANWQALIEYDPATGNGMVTAVIDTTSLTLGSVTDQAKGAEFFDVTTHASATFEGEINQIDGVAHEAVGTLTLVGVAVPVTLAFELEITDGVAVMSGNATLDRRDFNMGTGYPDESSVGFLVDADITLTAQQSE